MLTKNPTFRGWGRVHEKPVQRGRIAYKGGLRQFADLRGERLDKKEGVVFFLGRV